MVDNSDDHTKFACRESARIIRTLQDRIGEITYTGVPPSQGECESLCDMMIELHHLLYEVTLFTFRGRDLVADDAPPYVHDDVYSDGQSVISRIQLPTGSAEEPIPPCAYRGDVGDEVPHGIHIRVWRPGEAERLGLSVDTAVGTEGSGCDYWEECAGLRAAGLLEWSRDDSGRIEKRAGGSGRLQAVSHITPQGVAMGSRIVQRLMRSKTVTTPRMSMTPWIRAGRRGLLDSACRRD
jgi:hypothetical protein